MNQSANAKPRVIDITAPASPLAVSRAWVAGALALFMIVPLVSAYFLLGQSLRLDEAQSLWQTSRSLTDLFAIIAGDVHVPLYHVFLHYWRILFGDGVVTARLLSLAFFLLSILALYLLGARAYSRRVGLFAAFLFALSPFMNWYATEIRMYTLFAFLTIVNQYCFVRLFRDRGDREGVWAFYALTALLGVFAHYFFFLNLAAQAVFFALRRAAFPPGSLRRLLITFAIVGAAFAPWAWFVYSVGTFSFQQPVLVEPTSVNLFNAFSQFLFGFQNDAVNTIVLSLWPIVVIFGLLSLKRSRATSPETAYFSLTVLVSFGIAFVASFLLVPLFVSRYLIFTLPAFYLIIGNLFDAYRPPLRILAGTALVVLMMATLGIEITDERAPVKERYREAVSYLNAHTTPQDVIILSAPFTIYPVQYYYRGPSAVATLPRWNQFAYGPIPSFNERDLPEQVADITRDYQNVYVLLSYDQGYEETIRRYFDSNYERLYEEEYSNDLTLYAYRLRYNTERSAITTSL